MTALPRCKALCFALAPLLAALLSACAHTTESGEKWGGVDGVVCGTRHRLILETKLQTVPRCTVCAAFVQVLFQAV